MLAPVPVSNFERATALSCIITEKRFWCALLRCFCRVDKLHRPAIKMRSRAICGLLVAFLTLVRCVVCIKGHIHPEHRAKFSTRHTGNSICPRVYVYLYIPLYRGIKVNITSPRGYWENRNIKVLMSMSWAGRTPP